ncbi:MAG TPA: MFS transporter [Chroococcales cyanobacterium]
MVAEINDPYAAVKIGDFRRLLTGRLFVTVALQIQSLAVGWQIYELTKNPLALGCIGLAEVIPAIGVALYAGHVADKVDRRKIALLAIFIMWVCMLLLGGLSFAITSDSLLLPVIYIVIAFTGLARGFYGPAIFGLISDIVPRPLYGNAAAWNSSVWQFSAMAGPVLGGFLYYWLTAPATYLVSACLMFASGLLFILVRSRTEIKADSATSVKESMIGGLKFVFSNQVMLGAMALDLFAVLFGGAVALLPIFTSEVFHMGSEALGFLRAAPCIGALITSTILLHRPINHNAGKYLLIAVAGFGICMIAFGLSVNYYASLALLAVSGALDGVSVYVRNTIFQLLTPNDMKGRVSAVNNIFIGSSNEMGEFESGVTAKWLGLVTSVVFGGTMTLVVVLLTALKAPQLRNLQMNELFREDEMVPE